MIRGTLLVWVWVGVCVVFQATTHETVMGEDSGVTTHPLQMLNLTSGYATTTGGPFVFPSGPTTAVLSTWLYQVGGTESGGGRSLVLTFHRGVAPHVPLALGCEGGGSTDAVLFVDVTVGAAGWEDVAVPQDTFSAPSICGVAGGSGSGRATHVALAVDPGPDSVAVYLDGVLATSYTGGSALSLSGGASAEEPCLLLGGAPTTLGDCDSGPTWFSGGPGVEKNPEWEGVLFVGDLVVYADEEVDVVIHLAPLLPANSGRNRVGSRVWGGFTMSATVEGLAGMSPYSAPGLVWVRNIDPVQSGSTHLELAGGADAGLVVAPALIEPETQSSLYLEPRWYGVAASAVMEAQISPGLMWSVGMWIRCWDDASSDHETIFSVYSPELEVEVFRLFTNSDGYGRVLANGTELYPHNEVTLCTGRWIRLIVRYDPIVSGVRVRAYEEGAERRIASGQVEKIMFPEEGESWVVLSLGHAITRTLSPESRIPVLGSPETSLSAGAFFDVRVFPFWYNTLAQDENVVCSYRYAGMAGVWTFADASDLSASGAPRLGDSPVGSPPSLGPLAASLRDRPREWVCPHKMGTRVFQGSVVELFEFRPVDARGLNWPKTKNSPILTRFAQAVRGVEKDASRPMELYSAAADAFLRNMTESLLSSPESTHVFLGGVHTGTDWEWDTDVSPGAPFTFLESGAPPAGSPFYVPPGSVAGLDASVDDDEFLAVNVSLPGDEWWVPGLPTLAEDVETTEVWGMRTLGVALITGNCSSSAVASAGFGNVCPPGYTCCNGACLEGGACVTFLGNGTYNGHFYEVYTTPIIQTVWFVLGVAESHVHPTHGLGYPAQIASAGEASYLQGLVNTAVGGSGTFLIDGSDFGHRRKYLYTWGPMAGSLLADYREDPPVVNTYVNFKAGEPNNYFGGLEAYLEAQGGSGEWNDIPPIRNSLNCIVLEYGGCDPLSPCPTNETCVDGVCMCADGMWGPLCDQVCTCVDAHVDPPAPSGCSQVDGGCLAPCTAPYLGRDCTAVPPSPPPPPPVLFVCGDGVVSDGYEVCDDGNSDAGDGCSSLCDALEAGFACPVPGSPCVDSSECDPGETRDCTGLCGGSAVIDSCGVCCGGSSGVVPESNRDACGVCFGPGLDVCGGCGETMDGCGVCLGDNSTCAGCDGVPYSGKVVDVCGVCGGNGGTCLGCNGLPIPLGGLLVDACGVCGGNTTGTCVEGCDGNPGSTVDCAGVCGGWAVVDECGVCTGGNTSRAFNMHKDACGTCFGSCVCGPGSGSMTDECGVCAGDNSTCVGCNGLPYGSGGLNVDICGVCGGDGSSCELSCSSAPGPVQSFDCVGVCGGSAMVDTCGVCYGGTTGVPVAEFHLDDCDVCFGANRNRDVCGVCVATLEARGKDRDSCGVCFGEDVAVDSCGVCFGTDRAKDMCGVCFGSGDSCLGCDGIPNSGLESDGCGVCGGDGSSCLDSTRSFLGMTLGEAAVVFGSGSLLCGAFILCLLGIVWVRRRKKVHSSRVGDAMKEAPSGRQVAFVVTDIEGSTALWEIAPPGLMEAGMEIHDGVMREALEDADGYEIRTEGDAFLIAFRNVEDAIKFCAAAQQKLFRARWPPALVSEFPSLVPHVPGLWRGPRVRMGIHIGPAHPVFDERTQRSTYRGNTLKAAELVSDVGNGGEIVMSVQAVKAARARLGGESFTFVDYPLVDQAVEGKLRSMVPLSHLLVPGLEKRVDEGEGKGGDDEEWAVGVVDDLDDLDDLLGGRGGEKGHQTHLTVSYVGGGGISNQSSMSGMSPESSFDMSPDRSPDRSPVWSPARSPVWSPNRSPRDDDGMDVSIKEYALTTPTMSDRDAGGRSKTRGRRKVEGSTSRVRLGTRKTTGRTRIGKRRGGGVPGGGGGGMTPNRSQPLLNISPSASNVTSRRTSLVMTTGMSREEEEDIELGLLDVGSLLGSKPDLNE